MLRSSIFYKISSPVLQPPTRLFRCDASNRNLGVRFRPRRTSHHTSQVLLDKFIKHSKTGSSLVVKAPFSLKVRGSYFDSAYNVDRERNRQMLTLPKGIFPTFSENSSDPDQQPPTEREETPSTTNSDILTVERNILDNIIKNLSVEFTKEMKDDANLLKNQHSENSESKPADEIHDYGVKVTEHRFDEKFPLHVLFYGRSNHRLDSYSVLKTNNQHQSYVYISEASQFDEADSMFVHLEPSATVSIWQPAPQVDGLAHQDDEMVSGFKVFCPYHLLDNNDNNLKSVFLVPVSMGKIYLQSDRDGHVELDGSLLEDLTSIGLCTEIGNIKVKDLAAIEIKLASRLGDILCDGVLDGHVVAETFGDGDFLARCVEGKYFTVSTEDGDIHVWNDCRAEFSNFTTRRGQIHIRDLYYHANMEVTESGNITVNVASASINAHVERGAIFATIDSLTGNSILKVENGEVNVTISQNAKFRIQASASRTNISPKLLNSGEIFLSDQTGHETFVTHAIQSRDVLSSLENLPTLTLFAANGSVNINVTESEEQKCVVEGYDSVS